MHVVGVQPSSPKPQKAHHIANPAQTAIDRPIPQLDNGIVGGVREGRSAVYPRVRRPHKRPVPAAVRGIPVIKGRDEAEIVEEPVSSLATVHAMPGGEQNAGPQDAGGADEITLARLSKEEFPDPAVGVGAT